MVPLESLMLISYDLPAGLKGLSLNVLAQLPFVIDGQPVKYFNDCTAHAYAGH